MFRKKIGSHVLKDSFKNIEDFGTCFLCVFITYKYIIINMQLITVFQVKRHCFGSCCFLCVKDEKALTCLFVCVRVYMFEYACVSICMCVDPISIFSV